MKQDKFFFDSLMSSTLDLVYFKDNNHRFWRVNKAYTDLLNLDEKDMLDKTTREFWPEAEEILKDEVKALRGDPVLGREREVTLPNGKKRWYSIYKFPLSIDNNIIGFLGMDRDITKMKENEKEIKSQRRRLTNIIEGANVGTWEWNIPLQKNIINEKYAEMLGYTIDEISPITMDVWRKFIHPDDIEKVEKMLEKHFNKEIDQYKVEFRMKHKDGHWVWIEDQGKVITWNEDGTPKKVYGTHQDITERKLVEKELYYKTYHDELTGLYNRTYFNKEIDKYNNEKKLPLSIIMGDVNGLKITNDTFGHKEGDRLLIKIAEIFKKSFRKKDMVVRTGGDEFIALLPRTSKKEAEKIAKNINEMCDRSNECKNYDECLINLSIALGVATKTKYSDTIEDVLKRAEDKMYQNKVNESMSIHNTIVNSLETMLRESTNETLEHSKRLEYLATNLGKKLDLSRHELNVLASLANLHDIGKITISKDILQKPTSLNDKEWEEIKRHPEAGYKIAKSSPKLNNVAEGILYHHERWDGNGYPQGLSGEQIPLLARIINIVDSYDVMTSSRPYKEAMNKNEALKEVEKCAGSQFDPNISKIFIKMMKNYINK
ncbi:MAG: sensor domain-containing diguanylate cyclase/phosphohydrolase [Bacillota bacterium]